MVSRMMGVTRTVLPDFAADVLRQWFRSVFFCWRAAAQRMAAPLGTPGVERSLAFADNSQEASMCVLCRPSERCGRLFWPPVCVQETSSLVLAFAPHQHAWMRPSPGYRYPMTNASNFHSAVGSVALWSIIRRSTLECTPLGVGLEPAVLQTSSKHLEWRKMGASVQPTPHMGVLVQTSAQTFGHRRQGYDPAVGSGPDTS